ncbi:MAG TPA: beta-propeller domain-containing protein [Candidatus Hydrogenedentes bacterium]|nr:beta-propeller domain-containing protein [Candidatus Hydrogenedentota bacterium]HPG66166.1 beta-propeller domain-containing protein [Candidatus Hydrogenedentota bacterium]
MTTKKLILVLALVSGTCCGCPRWFSNAKYTSADYSRQYRNVLGGLFGMAAQEDTGAEGETEVREVVEPDVIRQDGNRLYILNQYRGLTVVDLDSETILAQAPTYGYPRDLYIAGNRALVLVGSAGTYAVEGSTVHFDVTARLYIVDISAPGDAEVIGTFDLAGDLVDSRMVGDVLYAVCAEYQWTVYSEDGGVAVSQEVVKTAQSGSWVTSVNVADPAHIHKVQELSFDGYGDVIQASPNSIFVAAPDWSSDKTQITHVDISNPAGQITVHGVVTVDGYVADRFKMDEYNGVLRVVSGGSWNDRAVFVTTVDLATLEILGEYELEDALGEQLFATRFDGDRAYIVTYFVVDPLFVVDLSDPVHPAVVGALEVPGYSTHIEPKGDRLLALGVDDTLGGRRVCVSLFDVSDPARLSDPSFDGLIDRVTFGEGWSWSSAYDDVKALTVLDDVIVVPFSGWAESFGGYERLQFVSYTRDDLDARGSVDLNGSILRSLAYDGQYYGVTTEQLATIDASNLSAPQVVNTLTLAENVVDFLEISPTLAAEVIARSDTGDVLLRTVGLGKTELGEVAAAVGEFVAAHAYGQGVVLVGKDWTMPEGDYGGYESFYLVAYVDCSNPTAPVAGAVAKIDVEPYWGYIYRGGLETVAMFDKAEKQSFDSYWMPWWYAPEEIAFLVGDRLVLRCTGTEFDAYFGSENDASEGLAVIRLAEAGFPYTSVGLGYERVSSLHEVAGKLYLGTCETTGSEDLLTWWQRPLCAYYLCALDLEDLSEGPTVNVPGEWVQYDPESDLLTLKDYQWNDDEIRTFVRTMTWSGQHLDEGQMLELPDGTGEIIGAGAKVYFTAYDDGVHLYPVTVAPLALGQAVLVTEAYASLLGARGDNAYVGIGNAIARYDFGEQQPLADLVEVMGYPTGIRFGTDCAYIPLGYSGVAVLPQ